MRATRPQVPRFCSNVPVSVMTILCLLVTSVEAFAATPSSEINSKYYLPTDSKIVTVTRDGNAEAEVVVLTEAVAIK